MTYSNSEIMEEIIVICFMKKRKALLKMLNPASVTSPLVLLFIHGVKFKTKKVE